MVQQYGLLQSYLELDLEEEFEKNQRILSKGYSHFKPMSGAYVLDTQWNKFIKGENIELPVFERLLYTTGYCKAYWHSENIWRHCELDMCHGKGIFGGRISLLTHATGNGKNKILAFGIHTAENKDEWRQFYDFCKEHFPGIEHITSDRGKGLVSIEAAGILAGELQHVSHCILHIVRNELVARREANAGKFNESTAGGTVQSLATKLAKACTDELFNYYLEKLKMGNEFTADFLKVRRGYFSSSFILMVSTPVPAPYYCRGLYLLELEGEKFQPTPQSNLIHRLVSINYGVCRLST